MCIIAAKPAGVAMPDNDTLRKSLSHVRNPERHTDLAHLMSAGR